MAAGVDRKRREIENHLLSLRRQADEMDARIRAYLADRENKPHPHHQEFIEKIQHFRIDPEVSTKYLETILDNLQWKVYYYSRAWRQLWDNADALRKARADREKNTPAPKADNRPGAEKKSTGAQGGGGVYSVDRLWEIQKKKLSALGEDPGSESKDGFVQRIKQRYGKLASEKKTGRGNRHEF